MGILQAAKPAIIICARDRGRSTAFYRDTLGMALAYEDSFAAVFNIADVTLRISTVPDFAAHEHTAFFRKIKRNDRDLFQMDVLPDVQFRPV